MGLWSGGVQGRRVLGEGDGCVDGGRGRRFWVVCVGGDMVSFLQDEGMVEADGFWERWVCA